MKKVLVLFVGMIILFSPGKLFADESTTEERARNAEKRALEAESAQASLKAENKMLQAYIKNLKDEIAKMKVEIRRLNGLPATEVKQPQQVDGNSNRVKPVLVASTQPALEGNDIVAKALTKYNKTDKTTTAKSQEARKILYREIVAPIVIDFDIEDISIVDDNTAIVSISSGGVKTLFKEDDSKSNIRVSSTYRRGFKIKISSDLASKVEKGHKLTISGNVAPPPSNTQPSFIFFVSQDTSNGVYLDIKNIAITLNGQKVELVK